MKRVIDFGIVKYSEHMPKARCKVEVQLRYDEDGRAVFSACGEVWNKRENDCIMCGQCLDDMHIDNELFKEVRSLWKKYHLNDMHAGTYKQTEFLEAHEEEHRWDYTKCCELLEKNMLLVDTWEGKPYTYGHAWLYWSIPEKDLKRIEEIVCDR